MANGDFLTDNELYRLNSERMMVKDEVVEVD